MRAPTRAGTWLASALRESRRLEASGLPVAAQQLPGPGWPTADADAGGASPALGTRLARAFFAMAQPAEATTSASVTQALCNAAEEVLQNQAASRDARQDSRAAAPRSSPSTVPPARPVAITLPATAAAVASEPLQQGFSIPPLSPSSSTAPSAGPPSPGFKRTFYKRKLPSPPAIEFSSPDGAYRWLQQP
jgi:hypothetical protein